MIPANSENQTGQSAARSPVFATTHWTQVLAARGESAEARTALAELCAAYYQPVFAFIRSNSRQEESARDLTQEFFARLLERRGLDTVDPQRGRFRSYLLGAVKHFLADQRDQQRAAKRGRQHEHMPLGTGTDTSPSLEIPDSRGRSPEAEFDRQWALTILDRALKKLADEHAAAGSAALFEMLKPWLTGDTEGSSQAEAASQLDLSEGAVKVAIHRLRRRFRHLVKAEIGETLNDRALVEDELSCLLAALSGQ